jgi:hypothetical protein
MKLSQNGNCLSGAVYGFPTYISELYVDFNYYHKSNNYFIVEWSDGVNVTSVRFDTVNNLIYFSDYSVFGDFAQLGFPYSYWYSLPYTFGFSDGTLHGIRIDYSASSHAMNVTIDSVQVATISNPSHFTAKMLDLAFGQWNTGTTYAKVDDVVVYSGAVSKIIPQLSFYVSPAYTVTPDQTVTVQCFANYPDVPLTLYHFSTLVSNPFTGTLSLGMHYFDCVSIETPVYYSTSAPVLINVTSAVVPPVSPEVGNISWTTPEPSVCNATDMRASGTAWALPFCTPFFWAICVMLVFSGGVAYGVSKAGAGGNVGGVAFLSSILMFLLMYTFYGIFPAWIGIMLVIGEGMGLAYMLSKIFSGG